MNVRRSGQARKRFRSSVVTRSLGIDTSELSCRTKLER